MFLVKFLHASYGAHNLFNCFEQLYVEFIIFILYSWTVKN